MSKSTTETNLSQFEETLQGLEAFSKAYAAKKPGSLMDDPAKTPEEEEAERLAAEEAEAQNPSVTKSAATGDDDPNAMSADDFIEKSHAKFVKSIQVITDPQQKALVLMMKGVLELGKAVQSLILVPEEMQQLRKSVDALGEEPNVRKSMLSLHEPRPSGQTKTQVPDGADIPAKILAKANVSGGLVAQGRITPQDVAVVQHYANRGMPLPDNMKALEQLLN